MEFATELSLLISSVLTLLLSAMPFFKKSIFNTFCIDTVTFRREVA